MPIPSFDQVKFHLRTADGKPFRSAVPFKVARGIFFHVLGAVDPALGQALHDARRRALYALQMHVQGASITITFNVFDAALASTLKAYVLITREMRLRAGASDVVLEGVTSTSIDACAIMDRNRAIRVAHFVFKSPAFFKVAVPKGSPQVEEQHDELAGEGEERKSNNKSIPLLFPLPGAIVRNACNTWNDILGGIARVDTDMLAPWAESHLVVTSHDIKTRQETLGGMSRAATGFTGWARYKIVTDTSDDDINAAWLDKVFHLATFTNLGGNRTMGMGAIVYEGLTAVKTIGLRTS